MLQHSSSFRDHRYRVTRSYVAISLGGIQIIFTVGLLVVLKFIYVDVERIDQTNDSDSLKIVFWCLFASCFYTIFGAVGWSFGVSKRKLIFFWSWLILTMPTYALLWMLLIEVYCATSLTWLVLLLPQIVLQLLPLYFAGQYYEYKKFERAELVLWLRETGSSFQSSDLSI